MIMLHPDHRGGKYQEFRQTDRFSTLPQRPGGFDLGCEPQDAVPRKSHYAVAIDRDALIGHSALVLLFVMAVLLRSLW